MRNSSSFLYSITYLSLLAAITGIAVYLCVLIILLVFSVPQLFIITTGAGLIAFGGVVLFYLIKFVINSPTKDALIRSIVLSAGLILAGICGAAGVWMIMTMPFLVAVAAGLGIILFVAIVLFFFIRLLRVTSKKKNPLSIEITKAAQPKLFAFINTQLKTQFVTRPKKIFLSPDANITIFRRGHLEIGLGLVNNINISEFQALVIREFCYFRSSTIEDKPAPAWAGMFKYCVMLAAKMYTLFQRFLYQSDISLNRALTFYADGVAVYIAGSNNMIAALGKKEMARSSYNTALRAAGTFIKEKKISRNIYSNQLTVLRAIAEEYHASTPRINYNISIPTFEERIKRIEKDSIKRDSVEEDFIAPNETTAWSLFNDVTALQEILTANIYSQIHTGKHVRFYEETEFETWYAANPYKMPAAYKGFYSNRYPDIADWDLTAIAQLPADITFEQLFTEENGQLQATIIRNEKDIITLRSIKERRIKADAFDFKGQRFSWQDADQLITKIAAVDIEIKAKQLQLDKEAFAFFNQYSDEIMSLYQQYQYLQQQQRTFTETADKIIALINTFSIEKLSEEEIKISLDKLADYEKVVKNILLEVVQKEDLKFIRTYYSEKGFHEEELYVLRSLLVNKTSLLEERHHEYYRTMIERQLSIYKSAR